MDTSKLGISRVFRQDRELFPKQVFNWDKNKYKEELDKQVELSNLNKQVSKARKLVLERGMLERDRREANLNRSIRNGNVENLMKSFYGRGNDQPMDSFIQQTQPPKEDPAMDLPNKRDHIRFHMTGYAENDPEIIKGQKEAYKEQLNKQILDDRISQKKDTLKKLQDELHDIDKLEKQQMIDAGYGGLAKSTTFSRRSGRPRTPVEDTINPFEKLKMEEELGKYKRYLKYELPDMVTKQVNDIFEREESGLKTMMRERDQLLRMQLTSFHEYLRIMDTSRVREISDLNNLKLEVDDLKRANDVRVQGVERALNQTDQMLADEAEWKKLSKSYAPDTFYGTVERVRPYSTDLGNPWSEGDYLRGLTNNIDIRRDRDMADYGMRRVQSSFINSNNARTYEVPSPIPETDAGRKSRIDEIIHELDHIMDELNDPAMYKPSLPN